MALLKRNVTIITAALIIFINPNFSNASDINFIPSIGVSEEYIDNIFLSNEDESKVEDYITSISPSIEFYNKTERINVILFGDMDFLFYRDNSDFDTTDQSYKGILNYQFTPRLKMDLFAIYLKDSRRDRDIEETGLVILSNAERNRQQYNFGMAYDLSETLSTRINYSFNQDDYDDQEFVGNSSHKSGITFEKEMSDLINRLTGRLNMEYIRYDIDDLVVDDYSATVGAIYDVNQVLRFNFDVGARYTHSKFDEFTFDNSNNWGPIGKASLSYKGELTKSKISFSKDLKVISSRKGTSDRAAFTFELNRSIYEYFQLRFKAGYFINKADKDQLATEDIDEQTFRIQPSLQFVFKKYLTFSVGYKYIMVNDRDDNLNRDRNLFFINLILGYPVFN